MTIRFLFMLIIAAVLVGCDQAPSKHADDSLDELVAYTDAAEYNLSDQDVQVILTVENQTDSAAYFAHCCERYITMLQLYSSGQWEQVGGGWGFPCPAICLMGNLPLEPDSSYWDTGHFAQEGQYRYLLFYGWEPQISDWTDTLYSNAFTIQ